MRESKIIVLGVVRLSRDPENPRKTGKELANELRAQFTSALDERLMGIWKARMDGSPEMVEVKLLGTDLADDDAERTLLTEAQKGFFCVAFNKLDKSLLAPANAAAQSICNQLAPQLLFRSKWRDPALRGEESADQLVELTDAFFSRAA